MNEFIEQFLLESRELVEQATGDLLAVEESPGDVERLDSAFRAFHTLKGSAGIVAFGAMARTAHAAEDILALARSGKAKISRNLINNCLHCLDLILQWLDAMQVDGKIPANATSEAHAMMAQIGASVVAKEQASTTLTPSDNRISAPAAALLQAQMQLLQEKEADGLIGRLLSAGRVAVNILHSIGSNELIADVERASGAAAAAEDATPLVAAIEALLPAQMSDAQGVDIIAAADASARVLRVDVERIDALVKLTGEFIIVKNAIGHITQLIRTDVPLQVLAQTLKDQHGVLRRLIEELQHTVLSIRVLPMRHVFNRFPRMVREIAEVLGKSVRLVIEGEDTEADKVVVENLFEPLLHIIRNAVDHGVETATERAAAGKPPVATLQLRASRTGDALLVQFEDDGRGIDIERVRTLAAKREVASPEILARMSDEEISDLVFAAGFSTADTITDFSGRGVGMNVVRSSVECLGGTARVASRPGLGTTVTLRLPYSVMVTRIMTVEVGGQVFGLPLDHILETTRVPRDRISPIGKGQAIVLHDRTIPLIDLGRALGQADEAFPQVEAEAKVVVVSIDGQLGGLEVDRFGERLDVILKPMDGLLNEVPGVAGTSLLGNGAVLIVLDFQELLQ